MRKKSYLIIALFSIVCIAGFIAYTMWNKPFKNPLKGDAVKVTATQLFNDFIVNETAAQKKYVPEKLGDKKVEVTGQINEIGKNADGEVFYTLKTDDEVFGVKCIMEKEQEIINAKAGDIITVRGFCDGYNMDVIINRCRTLK